MQRKFRSVLPALVIIIFALSANAQEAPAGADRPIMVTSSREFRHEIRLSDFANVPVWQSDASEPPLSAGAAIRSARASLGRYVPSPELWRVKMVHLMEVGRGPHWYYRVMFICSDQACSKFNERSFSAVIKMDGNDVAPKRIVAVD
jgi:hypothetical protein